jgi:GAF domain-containing protein
LLVPLVAQGNLVGLLNLGPRAPGGAYSDDDLVFLTTIADEGAAAATIVRLLEDAADDSVLVPLHPSRAMTDV